MKCDTNGDCNGGKCLDIFRIGKFCSCKITPSTCINHTPCKTDQNCPGGKCVHGNFGKLGFDYCQCDSNGKSNETSTTIGPSNICVDKVGSL